MELRLQYSWSWWNKVSLYIQYMRHASLLEWRRLSYSIAYQQVLSDIKCTGGIWGIVTPGSDLRKMLYPIWTHIDRCRHNAHVSPRSQHDISSWFGGSFNKGKCFQSSGMKLTYMPSWPRFNIIIIYCMFESWEREEFPWNLLWSNSFPPSFQARKDQILPFSWKIATSPIVNTVYSSWHCKQGCH